MKKHLESAFLKIKSGMNNKLIISISSSLVLCILIILFSCETSNQDSNKPILIFSTDLTSPPGDPDDHFDLMTLLSLDEIDIRAIILDAKFRPYDSARGLVSDPKTVRKAMDFYGRTNIPVEVGVTRNLLSPEDKVSDLPEDQQKSIELIMEVLNSSPDSSVNIITVGSLRDIAVAYNRDTELFKRKVKRLLLSVGDSYGIEGIKDSNTALDVEAWKCIMGSNLPIDWMPTNPSKGRGGPSRYCSYWYFMQFEIEPYCSEEVKNYFLDENVDLSQKWQEKWPYTVPRHMWSTPAFIDVAKKNCYLVKDSLLWLADIENENYADADKINSYEFEPIEFRLDETGVAQWEISDNPDSNIRIFKINDYFLYNKSMFAYLKQQFQNQKLYD